MKKKKYVIFVGVLVCVLVLVMILGALIPKADTTRPPTESESQSEFPSESEEEIVKSSWVKDLAVAERTTQMIVVAANGIYANPGLSVLPYLQVDDTHHWVDDSNSKYYNQ